MEILFQNENTRIEYLREEKIIILHLLGEIKHEDYQLLWDTLLEKVMETGARKMIADQTKMQRSGMDSKAWLVAKWFPKAHKLINAHCKIAVIASKSLYVKIGGEYIAAAVRNLSNFDVRFVSSMESGIEWLRREKI